MFQVSDPNSVHRLKDDWGFHLAVFFHLMKEVSQEKVHIILNINQLKVKRKNSNSFGIDETDLSTGNEGHCA